MTAPVAVTREGVWGAQAPDYQAWPRLGPHLESARLDRGGGCDLVEGDAKTRQGLVHQTESGDDVDFIAHSVFLQFCPHPRGRSRARPANPGFKAAASATVQLRVRHSDTS